MKEPRVCLLKVLYYEAWEKTDRKDKILHCKDCPCKEDCRDLKELNKKENTIKS